MVLEIRRLDRKDLHLLEGVQPGVFDDSIAAERAAEFLDDGRHHLLVAVEDEAIVGFGSALHYVHPDKPQPELWINEIGVASTHRGRGLGRTLLERLLGLARELGCAEAWVATERSNSAAVRLYQSVGGEQGADDAVLFTFDCRK